MLSNILDRISFISLFIVIVLLPVFFLPFTRISVETSKGLLLVIGLAVSIIFWAAARFSDGNITIPRSKLLLAGFGIVLVFLVSAIFSSARELSFFGIMLDVGSFWFIFAAFLLMLVSSIILKDVRRAKIVLSGTLLSSAFVLVFQMLHLLMPKLLSFGVLSDKTTNLLGSWSAFGLFAAFFSIVSLFAIEFFPISRVVKQVLGFLTLLALLLVAAVNFSMVWVLIGAFALIIFVYKISFSSIKKQAGEPTHFPIASFAVLMVSLLFFMSGQFVGGLLPTKLGLSNIEIRPSFSATMYVAKQAIKIDPVLGIGPNRFAEVWAMHKPDVINNTAFWDTSFDSGSGILPTFSATTGILGILFWIIFIVLFLVAGVRLLFASVRNNLNWESTAFFIGALFFFVSAFFYPVGVVMLLLAFAFTGIFVGLSSANREGGEISIMFSTDHRKSFFAVFLLLILMVVSAGLGFKYVERFASVSYFGKAIAAQNIPDAETAITNAITLHPSDLYLRTYSQVYILKLSQLANKGSTLTDAEKTDLQTSFSRALNGAQFAIQYNNSNYLNYRLLGAVYDTAGILGVDGAYEKAVEAYQKSSDLNPRNPGLKLSIARSLFAQSKLKEAKDSADLALALKADYADALILESQIAKRGGSNTSALQYAERALAIFPQDKDLIQYVNSLKNNSTATPPAPTTTQ